MTGRPAQGPGGERLTGEEIMGIARRIARALTRPPEGDPRQDILSQTHELPPEDEARVEAALVTLRAADPKDTSRVEPKPSGPL